MAPPKRLFVGTHGHVVALDKTTGDTLWKTSLPKTGYDVVSILVEGDVLFCASGGRAFALDAASGEIRWSNPLSALGSGLVYLASDQSLAAVSSFLTEAAAARNQATMMATGTT